MTGDDEPLLPAHPAFIGVRRLSYEVGSEVVAADAEAWLAWLREQGLSRVWLENAGVVQLPVTMLRNGPLVWSVDASLRHLTGQALEVTPRVRDLLVAATALEGAIGHALAARHSAIQREQLLRAQLILASPHDGEEVADTAWPHFILPAQEAAPRRRLLAAAATVLPQGGLLAEYESSRGVLNQLAMSALCAAVNGD
ncbi:MAG TPA: hypothetical protein VJU79_09830 [Candidatus Dormibacteraeota bacterium]|nr:hypothetical protein [Candidatus Dormibacteraeota bacterium]